MHEHIQKSNTRTYSSIKTIKIQDYSFELIFFQLISFNLRMLFICGLCVFLCCLKLNVTWIFNVNYNCFLYQLPIFVSCTCCCLLLSVDHLCMWMLFCSAQPSGQVNSSSVYFSRNYLPCGSSDIFSTRFPEVIRTECRVKVQQKI